MAAEEDLTGGESAAAGLLLAATLLAPAGAAAQYPFGANGQDLADAPGESIYAASCANCHGLDGRGLPPELVAFEEKLPDFADCEFAAREPDGDWIAVAHEGGPVRGFSEMMPAFRGALTVEQLGRVIGYIRTLCSDDDWPRGELDLPRALLTEKAYPEDQRVIAADAGGGDAAGLTAAYVYEHRFGPRSQVEVAVPYGWRGAGDGQDPGGAGAADGVAHGLGDVAIGVKHAFHHDLEAGRIASVMGEVILPTGDESLGLGAPGGTVALFLSAGQILPGDAFLQGQTGIEAPLYEGGAAEAVARVVAGASRTQGPWGRTWSPMLEVQLERPFGSEGASGSGAGTNLDLVPQVQVSLNTRQHVLANVGLLLPLGADEGDGRSVRLLTYLLLDW